jgi:zinc protease
VNAPADAGYLNYDRGGYEDVGLPMTSLVDGHRPITPCTVMLLPLLFVARVAAPTIDIPVERYTLPNGIEVLLHQDNRAPLVAVNLWVHVGSGDEQAGKSGFAHLFEHMMFQGAKHIGEDVHFDVLREAGATGVNGTTNSDRTNYFEVVPSNQLETALWLESDRVGFLLDMLSDKSLANQRDVVRNERRQRYDNVPYGKARFVVAEALYPVGHPYRYLTIGKHEELEAASIGDVKAFFQKWYAPSNVTLAIGGDIDIAATKLMIDKWFASLPSPSSKPKHQAPPAARVMKTVRHDVADPFARLKRMQWSWHSPARLTSEDLAMGVVADVLGAPGWGRLHRRLVVDEPLAQDVSVSQWGKGFQGQFDIAVTLKPGSSQARVEAIVAQELAMILTSSITAAELNRSRVNTEAQMVFALDDLMTRVDTLQSFNHYTGDASGLSKYLTSLRALTPDRVKTVSSIFLNFPHVLVVTTPASASTGGAP